MKASILFVILARSGPKFCSRQIPLKNAMIKPARESLSSRAPRAAARLSMSSRCAKQMAIDITLEETHFRKTIDQPVHDLPPFLQQAACRLLGVRLVNCFRPQMPDRRAQARCGRGSCGRSPARCCQRLKSWPWAAEHFMSSAAESHGRARWGRILTAHIGCQLPTSSSWTGDDPVPNSELTGTDENSDISPSTNVG